jgi:hypothetical protein
MMHRTLSRLSPTLSLVLSRNRALPCTTLIRGQSDGLLRFKSVCREVQTRSQKHSIFLTTLLALALAGCQTIKPLPPTGRVIPCSTVAEVAVNAEAIDHLSDRAARQLLGNDRVIGELCRKKK